RACLEGVLLKRITQVSGSHEGIFSPHSSAMGRKNGKERFQELGFAAKMIPSKHTLRFHNDKRVLIYINKVVSFCGDWNEPGVLYIFPFFRKNR
ncbi:MAG: hypothetical protein KDD10_14670, partial [Phaeodactylibacter sp.]|nr:hypothetical protein [Phaeodactylibacter sp.]